MQLSPSQSKICFFFQDTRPSLKNRSRLKEFIVSIFKKEGKQLHSLNYIFCNDKTLLDMNRQYLNHDEYTDIISFELSSKKEPVVGEIYISVDRVRHNARKLETSLTSELTRVIFHGALHLCGYKDKTRLDQKTMRLKEDQYLSLYY